MKYRNVVKFVPLIVFVLAALACGRIAIGVENDGSAEITSADTPAVETAATSVEAEVGAAQYWRVVEDFNHGLRFAIPCFWNVEFPSAEIYPDPGMASYQLYNYPTDYPLSFPRSVIPAENGAIKVDFDPINLTENDLPGDISLADYIAQENASGDSEVLAIDEVTLNQTPAVVATIHYPDSDSTGRYYLLRLNGEYLLRISVYPSSKIFDTADMRGILGSITLDPDADVPLPVSMPSNPPIGVAAACIPQYAEAVQPTVELSPENTTCGVSSFKSLDYLTTKVSDYLQIRNTGGLRWEYLFPDPMVFQQWGGEAQQVGADQFATMLANQLYDATGETVMTFTDDRTQFPPLGGSPAESLLGPGVTFVKVIYSEGWGLDGQGAALLYFAQDECGGYYWYGIVFDGGHFDK